jgi:hypothetical protein
MEGGHGRVILQVKCGFPSQLIVPCPFYVVLVSLSTLIKAETFNTLNKVFLFVLYNDRLRWWRVLAWYIVLLSGGRTEERYMEYRVYLHRFG